MSLKDHSKINLEILSFRYISDILLQDRRCSIAEQGYTGYRPSFKGETMKAISNLNQAAVKYFCVFLSLVLLGIGACGPSVQTASISQPDTMPLAEHPRPDFQRPLWSNLNGLWDFKFDKADKGLEEKWQRKTLNDTQKIMVPFSWGSKLSGVKDDTHIGWYQRQIEVPQGWNSQRVFLVIGASDWHTIAWLDGKKVGEHKGGYTPFEFDLTDYSNPGQEQVLTIRVDDTPHKFKLEGKQGYGRAAGIWQTVYLESRPMVAMEFVHFTPDIDNEKVNVRVKLDKPAATASELQLKFRSGDLANPIVSKTIAKGKKEISFDVAIPNARLWQLDDPFLYEVTAILKAGDGTADEISTYFGMRKIGVMNLPSTEFAYISLNNKPIYLQMALDQAHHPDGFYTFPSDEFMRDEILRSKQIGLNGHRIHVKIGIPRKLYWADKLGVLIMADVPNSWGVPDEKMRHETEYALKEMIKRDYNHPAVFSWVIFNETWGLFSFKNKKRSYYPETQEWVEQLFHMTKELDPTRLVEDNSPCNNDHVVTDINTWHSYLPGYMWRERLDQICRDTYPGSKWNYIGGRLQGNEPMLNSECGNVWGYHGSAGDVDWSWDYHIMINEFRRHPKICGWLYTEHHDVINEWNGYWRYDRSNKFTGIEQLVEGMKLNDLHNDFYIAMDRELCRKVKPGQSVSVPLFASFMTDKKVGSELLIEATLFGWDTMANKEIFWKGRQAIEYKPWMQKELESLNITMPEKNGLAILAISLKDRTGSILNRNFCTYYISDGTSPRDETIVKGEQKIRVIRFAPSEFDKTSWSLKQWNVLDGLKVNGAGSGYFEYRIPWPNNLKPADIEQASLRMELSAKQLFGKDKEGKKKKGGDFMRGRGTHDPSSNPNSYPMTDETKFPSMVQVSVCGESAGLFDLPDDSADHRGILSWYSQKRDKKLREAGSYGYLINAPISAEALRKAYRQKELVVRLQVDKGLPGGVAIYGEKFGRYPLDSSIIFEIK